ncbi:MAG: rhomboid family intramembrane serine protease [Spirochaetales bacterium]|nr:rhomboid family intramembrane serine protease [Spirochaetales bacterium]
MRDRAFIPITRTVFFLLILFSLAFIISSIAMLFNRPPAGDLRLHFSTDFAWYQPFTHLFVTDRQWLSALIQLGFMLLMLWSFGSELETNWGSLNFIKFVFYAILGSAALPLLASPVLPGLSIGGIAGILGAVLVAYAIIWPDREAYFFFVLKLKMKWIILILFLLTSLYGFPESLLQQSGGALAATFFLYYHARRRGSPSSGESRIKEYFRRRRLKRKQREIDSRIQMKAEVDRLLDKISREGMNSLSRKEKTFLDRASREF